MHENMSEAHPTSLYHPNCQENEARIKDKDIATDNGN